MAVTGEIALERVTGNIGAVINGIDLRQPQSAGAIDTVRQALINHGVIFFRRQDIRPSMMSREQFTRFVANEIQRWRKVALDANIKPE